VPELRESIRRDLQLIRRALASHPDGLTVGQIADILRGEFAVELDPRAVSYRLRLMPAADVQRRGTGKGTRYWLSAPPRAGTGTVETPPPSTSAEADAVRALIRQPRETRPYVTYDADWLFAYVPGETFYLPRETRLQLAELGRSPADTRPAGTFAREIMERLLIDLSWASSRLEGNTYSRLDTQLLLEFGQRADGKDVVEAQMILNHKAAIELLVGEGAALGVSERLLRSLHATLAENLMPNRADEGQLRRREVRIGNSNYLPTAVPQVIVACFAHIATTAAAIDDPFEQAFFLMVHLPYLQPFNDVNKRTSRLAANIPLIARNLCPLTFVDVPEQDYVEGTLAVYEFKRVELLRETFVRAYRRSCELYLVAQEAVAQPDPLRLRYRDALSAAIVAAVRAGVAPSRPWGLSWAAAHGIPAADHEGFADLLRSLLTDLNDASAARHRLSPTEFVTWRERFRPL